LIYLGVRILGSIGCIFAVFLVSLVIVGGTTLKALQGETGLIPWPSLQVCTWQCYGSIAGIVGFGVMYQQEKVVGVGFGNEIVGGGLGRRHSSV
jgi:hypothetical protein